jgi:hypothetical protein
VSKRRESAGRRRQQAAIRHADVVADNMERKEREITQRAAKQAYIAKFATERLMIIRERSAALRFARRRQIMDRVRKATRTQKKRRK